MNRTAVVLRHPLALAIAALSPWLAPGTALAEEAASVDAVIVTATRTSEDVTTVPQAITVIDKDEIAKQAATASSLSEILGKYVPGMAVGSGTQTNYNQTIRGRGILVLIDGVPQITVRNVARDLMTIDPSLVERVEVIRGATAIYGHGASGGVVNIITKKPAAGETKFTTEIGAQTSLTRLKSDGVGGWVRQGISHDAGAFDASLNLSAERLPAKFDADGDRIAPEPAQGDLTDTEALLKDGARP
jgi:iron complex outermembrane receptor protein